MAERTNRPPRAPMAVTVTQHVQLSPSLVRVVVSGSDLARFEASASADSYVKVLFGVPGVVYPRPLDMERVRADYPAEQWPRVRSYTVRHWDAERAELTLDFVVHGDQGVAGAWAVSARPGDELFLLGPGGGYEPDPHADWHLLVGDESALPAIAVALERLPTGAEVHAFVEVHGPADVIALSRPVEWVFRAEQPVGVRLVEAVRAAVTPSGTPHAFVHGEAGFVRQLRSWIRLDLGVPKEKLSISGYWRYGDDDEGWRAAKAAWNQEIEATERAVGR